MSCCVGKRQKGGKSKVEDELKASALRDKLNFKILILGAGESGKSTVIKQLKLIHKVSLTPKELAETAMSLRRNSLQCMLVLVSQAESFQYSIEDDKSKEYAKFLGSFDLDLHLDCDPKIAEAITYLWGDSVIKKTFDRRSEYWILDSAEYYFENIARFMEEEFSPTEEDSVMARVMTLGILSTEISIPPLRISLVDVAGQRTERRKWIHCFDNVNAIIFVVNLAGYNMVLFEDPTENRMKECYNLFKQTVNNPTFANTPFYLLFNKKDLFESKIRKDPITVCELFSDYTGPEELMETMKYIEDKFRAQITHGDPKRLGVFHVASRFKRDIKNAWDDIIKDIKVRNKRTLEMAIKELGNLVEEP